MIDLIGSVYLVALISVRGDDMQDFTGNAMLVCERDAAERVTVIADQIFPE